MARFDQLIWCEPHGPELTRNRLFDLVSRQVRQITEPVLPATAEEVLVELARTVLCFGVDEAVLSACVVTVTAVEHAAKEVVVDAVELSPLHTNVDDLLDAGEQLGGDERFMAARVELTFEGDHADVVRVAQNQGELATGEWSLWPLRGLAGGQALLSKRIREANCAVVPGRILLERPLNKWCTLRIDRNRVDQATVKLFTGVLVAEFGAADSSSVLCLMEQLVLDVLARLAHLHLIEDIEDRFHGVAHVAVTEVLLRGDQLDAHGREYALGDCGVALISEDPGPHVDDHVAHLRMLFDVTQHLAKHWSLGDLLFG